MTSNEIFGNPDTNFVSFDELKNAFKTPTQRQADYEPNTEIHAGGDDLSKLANPDGFAFDDFERLDDTPPVDHEHAMRTGERIARLIDTGIDFTLSNFVARNGEQRQVAYFR